jgi:hypothetical protein
MNRAVVAVVGVARTPTRLPMTERCPACRSFGAHTAPAVTSPRGRHRLAMLHRGPPVSAVPRGLFGSGVIGTIGAGVIGAAAATRSDRRDVRRSAPLVSSLSAPATHDTSQIGQPKQWQLALMAGDSARRPAPMTVLITRWTACRRRTRGALEGTAVLGPCASGAVAVRNRAEGPVVALPDTSVTSR